mmetsp:Transcript_44762/g.142905  ORF Transcript_44762/g.142905 Transcript_44762/m.142905 type:complete len:256 (+) Transcript_44762:169-936(+)
MLLPMCHKHQEGTNMFPLNVHKKKIVCGHAASRPPSTNMAHSLCGPWPVPGQVDTTTVNHKKTNTMVHSPRACSDGFASGLDRHANANSYISGLRTHGQLMRTCPVDLPRPAASPECGRYCRSGFSFRLAPTAPRQGTPPASKLAVRLSATASPECRGYCRSGFSFRLAPTAPRQGTPPASKSAARLSATATAVAVAAARAAHTRRGGRATRGGLSPRVPPRRRLEPRGLEGPPRIQCALLRCLEQQHLDLQVQL